MARPSQESGDAQGRDRAVPNRESFELRRSPRPNASPSWHAASALPDSSRMMRLLDRRGLPMRWRLGLLPAIAVAIAAAVLGHSPWTAIAAGAAAFVVGFVFARLTLWPIDAMCRRVEVIAAGDLSQRVNEPRGTDAAAHLGRLLNAMLGRLEGADLRQRRFISDAAHELRSPVAATSALLEAALAMGSESGLRAAAHHALAEQRRLASLVSDLLILATGDEGALEVSRLDVDLDDLALEVAASVRALGRVMVDTTGVGPGRLKGDPQLLSTLVRNLLDNAERHAQGRVAVSLVETAGTVTLTVDDDGPGIAPADRERVFQRFSQLQSARSGGGTAGLGLALVRSICDRHNGTVIIETSPLGGARFTVTFPS